MTEEKTRALIADAEKHQELVVCGNAQHTNFEVGCPDCAVVCDYCTCPWPCDARKLADALSELRAQLARVEAQLSTFGAVDPEWIKRQREQGWPDMHPEDYCHRCGLPNQCWAVESREDWLAATSAWASETGREGICCFQCFTAMYREQTGEDPIWAVNRWMPAPLTVPDGDARERVSKTVTTPEEEATLPYGTVVLFADGVAAQLDIYTARGRVWRRTDSTYVEAFPARMLPATVLHEPDQGAALPVGGESDGE